MTTAPFNRFADATDVAEVITRAVGAGSTCWVGGTGELEFDSHQAQQIAEDAFERIGQILVEATRLHDVYEKLARDHCA